MNVEREVLNTKELLERLGISYRTFYRHRRQLQHLEVKRPIGQRRYSRVLVEQFVAGESTVQFGRSRRVS